MLALRLSPKVRRPKGLLVSAWKPLRMGKQRSSDEVSKVLGTAVARFQSRARFPTRIRSLAYIYQANMASMSDVLGEMRVIL